MSVCVLREAGARTRIARPIVVAVLTLASAAAVAQLPPRPDAGQILEQQREPLRLPPPADTDVRPKVPEPRPALPVSPTLKVRVTRFTFSGNTLFSDEQLEPIVQEFLGKELDFEGLTDAATKVRAYHRERGYFLAQAYLPQQAIRDGVVEIAVIEGRVGIVELQRRPATRLAEWLLAGILDAHLKSGDIITETGLEKPLLLINDLPTAAVTSEIRPSRTIGAADLRVNVDQGVGLFNGYIDFDNHGSRFTGEYRLGASVNMNNPLTIGDQATFRVFGTDEQMYFGRAAYLVPLGFYGTRIGLSVTQFSYTLAKDFAPLLASGEGLVKSAFAFHPLYRTRNTNLIAQFAYEDKRLFDRIDATNTVEDRFIDSIKGGVVGDFRDAVFGGGLNAFSITYTQGDLKIAPTTVAQADVSSTGLNTVGKFRKWNYDFKRLNRITENMNFLFALSGQQASKNLASAEKISLGGPNGVRAYPVGEANGDSGNLITTELRYIWPGVKVFEGDLMVFALFDWGQVEVNEKPLPTTVHNRRSINGYGVGTSLGREGEFVIRGSASWQGDEEDPQADTAKRVPRVWVQAVKWF
ncbi:MAG TPA: ShlB/FhaC/HecB family hemolysin secretion/activation protein [Burkholderiales bacterium]